MATNSSEYMRAYRAAHREQLNGYQRTYYARHPEKAKAKQSKWHRAHKAYLAGKMREYCAIPGNREKKHERDAIRRWRLDNTPEARALALAYYNLRMEIRNAYHPEDKRNTQRQGDSSRAVGAGQRHP